MLEPLSNLIIEPAVRAALQEDLGRAGDVTSATGMFLSFRSQQLGNDHSWGLCCSARSVRDNLEPLEVEMRRASSPVGEHLRLRCRRDLKKWRFVALLHIYSALMEAHVKPYG